MADQQQTRVILVNGQAIILQGDSETSVEEINQDLLQQALQEVSSTPEIYEEENECSTEAGISEPETNENVILFHQEQGGVTQTFQITVEQAEALGLHLDVDDKPKVTALENGCSLADNSNSRLLYNHDIHKSENEIVFSNGENTIDVEASCAEGQQSSTAEDSNHLLTTPAHGIDLLSSTVIEDVADQPITLIPQYVNGQMTYTVKIDDEKVKPNLVLKDTSISGSSSFNTTVNARSLLSSPNIETSASPGISIPSTSTVSASVYTVTASSSPQVTVSSASVDKGAKVSYVLIPPTTNTNNSIVQQKLIRNHVGKLSERYNICQQNQSLSPNLHIGSQAAPGTIPVFSHAVAKSGAVGIPKSVPAVITGNIVPTVTLATNTTSSSATSTATSASGNGLYRLITNDRTLEPVNKFKSVLSSTAKVISSASLSHNVVPSPVSNSGPPTKLLPTISTIPKSVSKVSHLNTTSRQEPVSNLVQAALTRMPVPSANSAKPLGSSENPIQLVQHGQTFHSVQSLSQEQLRQIATVLQQQHLDSTPKTKNVLYDPETNTRIIYRVVYPEDLDLREPISPSETKTTTVTMRGRGRRGRPPKTVRGVGRGSLEPSIGNITSTHQDEKLGDDSAKGERKKQLPRTRSGRLSRPPRHMVKDYKRLHHLDFADADLDDSDGGYSDYQMSENENEQAAENKDLFAGLEVPKRKISSHFRCPTCQKVYLGHARMARHLEVFPDHGNIEEMQVPVPEKPVNGNVRPNTKRRKGKRKGPWAYKTAEARSERRKSKLREAVSTCEASELSEVCGPVVAGSLSLWDLLLLRVEAVRMEESPVATLCDELQAFLAKLRDVAGDIFQSCSAKEDTKTNTVELHDELLCSALGLTPGLYCADELKLHFCDPFQQPVVKKLKENDEVVVACSSENKQNSCPKVLSALTLVAKPVESAAKTQQEAATLEVSQDKPSTDITGGEPHSYLLASDSDMCVETMDPDSVKEVQQTFESSEQHAQDLQTVDDIVNERLNNLAGGNNLEEFNVEVPITLVSGCMPSSEERSELGLSDSTRNLRPMLGVESVPSFEELALNSVTKSNHLNENELSSLDSLKNMSGRQTFASESPVNQDTKISSAETVEPFPSCLPEIQSVSTYEASMLDPTETSTQALPERDTQETFHSGIVLPNMVEDVTRKPVEPSHEQFINSLSHMEKKRSEAEASYCSNVRLEGIIEGDVTTVQSAANQFSAVSRLDVTQRGELSDTDKVKQPCERQTDSKLCPGNTTVGFDTRIGLNSMTSSKNSERSSYESEMSLSTIESSTRTRISDSPHITFQTRIEQAVNVASHTFDPGHTLVGINNTNQTLPEPELMDVSLDEAGPELDFEVLSEEFNRNTRQS